MFKVGEVERDVLPGGTAGVLLFNENLRPLIFPPENCDLGISYEFVYFPRESGNIVRAG